MLGIWYDYAHSTNSPPFDPTVMCPKREILKIVNDTRIMIQYSQKEYLLIFGLIIKNCESK